MPLFAGYDIDAADPAAAGRIVTFDATGGRYEEQLGYHAVGSGSVFARGRAQEAHDPDADLAGAIRTAVEALYDAADDDTATGGPGPDPPDLPGGRRRHRPTARCAGPDAEIGAVAEAVVAGRTANPGG